MHSILGLTPLHLAVQDGNKKLAKMLLDCGADINAVVSKDYPTSSFITTNLTFLSIMCILWPLFLFSSKQLLGLFTL